MKQRIPKTHDVYKILDKIFNSADLKDISFEETIQYFLKYLQNYLLDKLLLFKLEHINYTIDNDTNLILDTLDELIIDDEQKKPFFSNINDCITKFLSIITETDIELKKVHNVKLLGNPIIVPNSDENYNIYTYDKDIPADITKYLVTLINALVPSIEPKVNSLTPIYVQ